ncbi:four-carbon acid sugar kinase family protein [Thiobacillus denitrificans]|uniref:Hrp-dependent type III effector protein n=1 Tax=Thiobacillus denitrificans TaxID=36861 RepID=A0A106BN47_THIDE|nr:four-carbon acid sugar kinase family protein [Thiobacillus denitrificans]KVW95558.1 Hrp-dependent type III effector protein [Thiobacillus denitrificans]
MTPKIIVLDDDPTGSQTVHSCLLLTRWDVATLKTALADAAPLFFILTNTRGMDAARAADVTREVCENLKLALVDYKGPVLFVSRSDSTLRGHYPVETDVMNAVLGSFDATILTPGFFEGGRITRDSTHYLIIDGKPVPTHETEFARDSVFGYRTAYLPDYVAEKTAGRVEAADVARLTLTDLRKGQADSWLASFENNAIGVVDGESADDYRIFADAVLKAAASGRHLLFRSAASLLTALAKLPPQPVAAESFATLVRDGQPGAIIVGSHVAKTTAQLTALLKERGVVGLPLDVARLPDARAALVDELTASIAHAHARGLTPVVFTSRAERQFVSVAERLAFGESVSATLMDVVHRLPETLGFLISKGGITSNDVLSTGLELATSRVLGQILPGVTVVQTPTAHRLPQIPVVIFPGNVGGDGALAEAYRRLAPSHAQASPAKLAA